MNYPLIVLGTVASTLIALLLWQSSVQTDEIERLRKVETELGKDIVLHNVNYTTCKGNLSHQNSIVEAMRLKVKNFKPTTVEVEVFKHLPTVNPKGGDCDELKLVIDFMRNNPV